MVNFIPGEFYLGKPIWLRMEATYRKWVKSGYIGEKIDNSMYASLELLGDLFLGTEPQINKSNQHANAINDDPNAPPALYSMSDFISVLTTIPAKFVDGEGKEINSNKISLDMTFSQLQAGKFKLADHASGSLTIKEMAMDGLCLPHISSLLSESCRVSYEQNLSVDKQNESDGLLNASRYSSWEELSKRILEKHVASQISQALYVILMQEIGHKKLSSFFESVLHENGYRAWHTESYSSEGTPLKDAIIPTESGQVTVKIQTHTDYDASSAKVYEWLAELRLEPESEIPDAIACGMIYVLERIDGILLSDAEDVRSASDIISDYDVSQVLAFFNQHEDADELMEEGDLCFVWMWERKNGTAKGLGVECLHAALQNIKKRFRKTKNVIINLRPCQFSTWGEGDDPPELQVAKLDAIEKLEQYIRGITPEQCVKGELRFISDQPMSPIETMVALGVARLFG
jgi:hypothetical protein